MLLLAEVAATDGLGAWADSLGLPPLLLAWPRPTARPPAGDGAASAAGLLAQGHRESPPRDPRDTALEASRVARAVVCLVAEPRPREPGRPEGPSLRDDQAAAIPFNDAPPSEIRVAGSVMDGRLEGFDTCSEVAVRAPRPRRRAP